MRSVQLASGAAAVALLLSGCGGGEKTEQPSAAGSSGSSSSASSSNFDKAAATALAKTALFKIDDFPTGWSASEPEETPEDIKLRRQLAECLDAPADLFDDDHPDSAEAESSDFNSPDEDITISSGVAVAAPGKMRDFFGFMKGENVGACLTEAMDAAMKAVLEEDGDEMPEGAKFDKPKVGQLSFPTYGDESVPLRVSMTASYLGLSFDFFLDMLYVRSGDNGAFVTFEGTNSPVSLETEQKYAQLAADRLAALTTSS